METRRLLRVGLIFLGIIIMSSCVSLDLSPKNMLSDEAAFNSQAGVDAYFAKIYREIRMEDFNYSIIDGFNHIYGWQYRPVGGHTGEFLCRDIPSQQYETDDICWSDVYQNVRRINYFIHNFKNYESYFTPEMVNHLYGEAYFLRAYEYYALAKRYGGVPYITEVIDYPACGYEGTYVARNSEEETWDMISEDLDKAYSMMGNALARCRASRYTAAGLKASAMLFAGCIAKYNDVTHFDNATQKRVCGIPAERANDYFKQSVDAAKLVEGHASLFKKYWVAGDPESMKENLTNLFFEVDGNNEVLLCREYQVPEHTHSWNRFMINIQYCVEGLGSAGCPTLDFVEMFDGIPKNPDGTFKCYDEDGHYILYDNRGEPFENAEPRLKAYVLLPGDTFYGDEFDIRRGIYIGPYQNGIDPLRPEGSTENYLSVSQGGYIVDTGTKDASSLNPYVFEDGSKLPPCGMAGAYNANIECAHTGFALRKFMSEDFLPEQCYENKSVGPWIDLRYAEVMLDRAEAEFELVSSGAGDGTMLQDAFEQINAIRERAGATLLASPSDLTLDVIRTERRKELFIESRTYWDLRRWRIFHIEQDARIYKILMPFYVSTTSPTSATGGKYFFDSKESMHRQQFTWDQKRYYSPIPADEINRNPNMVQNPGY